MKKLVFSPAAIADIHKIWNYTAERWGMDQADQYTDTIQDACYALTKGIRTGRKVDIRAGYLKYLVGSHMIYYKQELSRINVVRILHGQMDIEIHL